MHFIDSEIAYMENKIKSLPAGTLIATHNGKYDRWYKTDGKHPSYIKKQDRVIAQQLAYKQFLKLRVEYFKQQKSNLSSKNISLFSSEQKFLDFYSNPVVSRLLTDYPSIECLATQAEWMNAPYDKNEAYPENLVFSAPNNLKLRSKSETFIVLALSSYNIPFRYECKLESDDPDFEYYPDFTILKPSNNKIYIWEHFGKMDEMKYVNNFNTKTQTLLAHGYQLGSNLICSFESESNPFTYEVAERLVQCYLL